MATGMLAASSSAVAPLACDAPSMRLEATEPRFAAAGPCCYGGEVSSRLALCSLLCACASVQRPAWTNAAVHPGYDEAKYLRAVGLAQSTDPIQARRLADLNAFAGVAEQVRVRVTSENVSAESEQSGGASQSFVAEVVQSFAQESLSALRVAERFSEEQTAWSLAVLDRAVALRELSRRVTEAGLAGSEARAAREQALQAGRVNAAFAALRDEYAAALRSVDLSTTASALQRDPEAKRLPAQSPAAVLGEARRLLDRLRIKKIAGDEQQLVAGAAARAPLEVQALLDEVPLQGLALRATPAAGAIDVETPPATDAAGRSRFAIPLVGRDPRSSYAIAVRADFSALRDGKDAAWDDVFAGEPATIFSFSRTVRRALRIELRATGELSGLLREQLTGRGYALVASDGDVVLEGEARAAATGATRIGTAARCSGELRVLRAGQLVSRIPVSASAVGATMDEALSRALRAGARNAADHLPAALQ